MSSGVHSRWVVREKECLLCDDVSRVDVMEDPEAHCQFWECPGCGFEHEEEL